MKNAPQVRHGDRVRVVLEGVAAESHYGNPGFNIGRNSANFIKVDDEHVVSVEVLAKQFKVGDTVSGDDYAKLPIGTVVSFTDRFNSTTKRVKVGQGEYVAIGGAWTGSANGKQIMDAARVIEYLP